MTVNADKAFTIDQDGLALTDDDGNFVAYVTGGSGEPTGAVPAPTIYLRSDVREIYFGESGTNWVKIDLSNNFSFWRVTNCVNIPENQEMIVSTCLDVETSGALDLDENALFTLLEDS